MIDIGLGPGYEIYDGYVLMKFTSSYSFQQCFLDGKLFFNTSDYFARCEETGRGDFNEGSTFVMNNESSSLISSNMEVVDGKCMIVVREYTENPESYKPSTIFDYSEAKNRRRKVISFYTSFLNIKEKTVARFPENMADEFGEFGIIILNRQEFFRRIKVAYEKQKNLEEFLMGFVEYQDLRPGINEWHPFRKDKETFGYQNEFRITFINDNESAYMLDLGCSLRDIAVPIRSKNIQDIQFVEDKLQYPKCNYNLIERIYYKFIDMIKK